MLRIIYEGVQLNWTKMSEQLGDTNGASSNYIVVIVRIQHVHFTKSRNYNRLVVCGNKILLMFLHLNVFTRLVVSGFVVYNLWVSPKCEICDLEIALWKKLFYITKSQKLRNCFKEVKSSVVEDDVDFSGPIYQKVALERG